MSQLDTALIRDFDLVEKLEKARSSSGGSLLEMHIRMLIRAQQERDEEAATKAQREAALATMPRDTRRRAIIREVFENEGVSQDNLSYMHSVLAVCGLPYRQLPSGIFEYERTQGRMGLVVTAGKLRSPDGIRHQQPVPFGPKARLLLAHLTTQAIRHKSPEIELADTLTGFLRELGYPATGGDAGTLRAFKIQLNALFACRMELSCWDGHKATTIKAEPFDSVEVFFSDNPDQKSLWASKIRFSDRMFNSLTQRAVPMDIRALRAFQGSARKLDLIYWIGYRLHNMRAPLNISYKALAEQFGTGFRREVDFKVQMAKDIAHLQEVFPKLPIKLTESGLTLQQADPEVIMIPKVSRSKKA
jgi:hypothetical protein